MPDEAIALIAVYPCDPDGCALDVTLWTVEEGASDLTLSLSATKVGDGFRLEIEDLHVL